MFVKTSLPAALNACFVHFGPLARRVQVLLTFAALMIFISSILSTSSSTTPGRAEDVEFNI